jgi:hypothetical protein
VRGFVLGLLTWPALLLGVAMVGCRCRDCREGWR